MRGCGIRCQGVQVEVNQAVARPAGERPNLTLPSAVRTPQDATRICLPDDPGPRVRWAPLDADHHFSVMRTLKRLFIDSLETLGLNAMLAPRYRGLGVVFLFHRVLEPAATTMVPGNAITTDYLDAILGFVRAEGWEIVGLNEIIDRLRRPIGNDRIVSFTFDDGFRDNLALALPVFRAHRAPLSVFLCTGFLEHRVQAGALPIAHRLPVGFLLAEYVSLHPGLQNERVRMGFEGGFATKPGAAYAALLELERRSRAGFDDAIAQLLGVLGEEPHAVLDRLFLDWDSARTLASDPLVTIGAHSLTHPPLATLNADDCRREMVASRVTLERELGVPVRYQAYPYGGAAQCGPREFEMSAAVGYDAALTTRPGNLFPAHRDRLQELPRVVVSMVPHAASVRFVKAALCGSRNAVMNRFSRFPRD